MTDEARKLKQQDNRRYCKAYWERRCLETGKTKSQLRREDLDARYERKAKANKQQRLTVEFDPDVKDISVTVCRGRQTDEAYIKALEIANKTLSKENRRLNNLLTQYQSIIRIGCNQYMREQKDQHQDEIK